MATPVYTWRDAGLHSRTLRAANRVGDGLRALGLTLPSLSPESLLAAAARRSGLPRLRDASLRAALDVLCESIQREGGLSTFGRIALRGLIVGALETRARLLDWAERHPEVRGERIERPWVIVGLPRTGTTLLSILLGLDPVVRPLLQWEASHPVPPPDLATRFEDPRIARVARTFSQLTALNPPILAMHPFGATLATECVTLLVLDLRALSIETQVMAPSYGRWLERTDMRGAYALHKLALQALQSRIPTQAWSLKTPNHLWCLDVLLETYPDARVVWTHRDPAKVVPSVASLVTALQRANAPDTDPRAVGAEWDRKLHVGVTRGIDFDASRSGERWCHHVQYREILADPIGAVQKLYAAFGEEPGPLHVRRMQAWLRDRPQEAFGRHAYDAKDFGLGPEAIRERYRAYRERYDVPDEGVV